VGRGYRAGSEEAESDGKERSGETAV